LLKVTIISVFQNYFRSTSLRTLRIEGHRRALVWQKKYLTLLIEKMEQHHHHQQQQQQQEGGVESKKSILSKFR
jgi:hypothetical protein